MTLGKACHFAGPQFPDHTGSQGLSWDGGLSQPFSGGQRVGRQCDAAMALLALLAARCTGSLTGTGATPPSGGVAPAGRPQLPEQPGFRPALSCSSLRSLLLSECLLPAATGPHTVVPAVCLGLGGLGLA